MKLASIMYDTVAISTNIIIWLNILIVTMAIVQPVSRHWNCDPVCMLCRS